MNELWFLVNFISVLSGALFFFGVRRYCFAINPISIFVIFDIGILTLLSAVVAHELNPGLGVGLSKVLYMSIVYIAGFFLIFSPRRLNFPRLLFDKLHNIVGKKSGPAGYSGLNHVFLIMLTFTLLVLLMQASGAGMLWFTNPRMAYQLHRAGAGIFFVMTQWALLASLLYYFFTRKPKLFGMIIPICIYSFLAYFTGSKANILAGFVMAGVYYNFFVRKISVLWIITGPIIILSFFSMLLLLQGSYSNFLSAFAYFKDYAEVTGRFLMRFDEFELQYGYAMLSDLWFYVPRGLFPGKPFEYGRGLIHSVLFPGRAEAGFTPGILPWTKAYLDFAVVGVFFSGVFVGIVRRGAYELFLANRTSVFAFILMLQLSLFPVFAYARLPLMIIIAFLFTLFCRKKIVFRPEL